MTADSSYSFRQATSDDAEDVSLLIGSTWAKFFGHTVSESDLETYLTKTVSADQIRKDIDDINRRRFLVAVSHEAVTTESSGEGRAGQRSIIGVAQLNLDTLSFSLTTEYPVELNRLYINPNFQGSGLARSLLEHVEQECRKMGKRGLWLGVWENNARAMRFYENMGFVRRGEHSFFVGESERRDWIMEKAL